MVDFNFFSVNSKTVQQNQEIKQSFLNLNTTQKKLLIKKLPSTERIALARILRNSDHARINQKIHKSLKDYIQNACHLTPEITRKDDRSSNLAKFQKNWTKFLDNLAYFFNVLTARKAYQLIQNELLKQSSPKTKAPQISVNQLSQLLKKARKNTTPGAKIELAKILKENGFSTKITGARFSDTFSLSNMNLEGITFENCKFSWTPCSNSHLKNVIFQNCDISNLSFMQSRLEHCFFDNCEMLETMFTAAKLEDVQFVRSGLIGNSFEDASLSHCIFQSVSMHATHFLEATIKESAIFKSNLQDTVFFGTLDQFTTDKKTKETAVVTKPTTAMLVHPEARGITTPKAYMKLDQNAHTIPLRITMQCAKVTKDEINTEVEAALKAIGPQDPTKPSIAQQLMETLATNPNSAKILKKADKLAAEVNSFFLPGGEDVPPALYGQKKDDLTDWGGDYRRSILELAMIQQSFNKGIPLMAICRGFQMSNVYFGAQLIQHVDGHKGIQKFELSTPEKRGLYANIMQENIVSTSFHHQGVPQATSATEHLEPAVIYEGLVKAVEPKASGASPMILLQFHPEFYNAPTAHAMDREIIDAGLNLKMSHRNEGFWTLLSDSANAHRNKQVALEQLKTSPSKRKQKAPRKLAIRKLEKKQTQTFEIYKKNYYHWKKGLFDVVKNNPNLLVRFLKVPQNEELDHFFEEREALEGALKHDAQFVRALMRSNQHIQVLNLIQETNPILYKELEKGALKSYIATTP